MEESANSKWIVLERIKKIVEILALLIAGVWAVLLFRIVDMPSLENRPSIDGDLKWTTKSKESCLAEYTVTFKNVGKSSIDLGRPTFKVWMASQPKLEGVIEYLDPHTLMSGLPQLQQELTNQEFGDHYPPDVKDTVTMTTIVKGNPGQILMFAVDFPQRDPTAYHFLDYRWGYACGESKLESPKKKRQ